GPRSQIFYTNNADSKAWFAQGTYDLSAWVPQLKATAGFRQTKDDRAQDISRFRVDLGGQCFLFQADGVTPLPGCVRNLQNSFDSHNYTLGLDYKIAERVLAYVTTR